MKEKYFEDSVFVEEKDCVELGSNFYEKQYLLVRRWYIKWMYIISNMGELEKAENFYNVYELFHNYKIYQEDVDMEKDRKKVEKEIKDDLRKYLQEGVFATDELEKAYKKFYKLGVISFSEYLEKNLKSEVLEELINKKLSVKVIKNKVECIDFCKELVEDIKICISENFDEDISMKMKIVALGELEDLRKVIVDYKRMNEALNVEEKKRTKKHEKEKKKFLKCYDQNVKDKKIKKEFLEIIFNIKNGRKWLIIDYAPYAEYIMNVMEHVEN